jgi:hypothetical protein
MSAENSIISPKDIKTPEVLAGIPMLDEFFGEQREDIVSGRYSALIVDRTVKVTGKIIEKVIDEVNAHEGRPKIPTTYVKNNPNKYDRRSVTAMKNHLGKDEDDGKALVVTGSVSEGGLIVAISSLLDGTAAVDALALGSVKRDSSGHMDTRMPAGVDILPKGGRRTPQVVFGQNGKDLSRINSDISRISERYRAKYFDL